MKLREITDKELQTIADRHQKYLDLNNRMVNRTYKANLVGYDLRGKDLSNTDWSQANFSGSDMRDAYLSDATFENANFTGVNLTDARFNYCKCEGANFTDAILDGTQFSYGDLNCARFMNADVSNADFKRCNLNDTTWKNNKLDNVDFSGAYMSYVSGLPLYQCGGGISEKITSNLMLLAIGRMKDWLFFTEYGCFTTDSFQHSIDEHFHNDDIEYFKYQIALNYLKSQAMLDMQSKRKDE